MKLFRIIFIVCAAVLVASCVSEDHRSAGEGDEHDDHAVAVTLWSDSIELFMEYHPPIAGRTTEFTIHITRLAGFRAADQGSVTVEFEGHGGYGARGISEAPVRNGIWQVEVAVSEADEYHLHILCDLPGIQEVFDGGHVSVWASEEELEQSEHSGDEHVEHGHEHADTERGEGEITFLKEQQWNTDFGVEPVRRVRMQASIPAVAEVLPKQQDYAEIVSPVDGLISVAHNKEMAEPGRRVKAGDPIVTVCPPLIGTGSWTERHLEYLRAKEEFERAERLTQRDAIAKREYEAIRQKYLVERSSYQMILEGSHAEPVEIEETGEIHLVLKAPINGIVTTVDVLPGQTVSAEQKLITIVDPSIVWLQVNLFERDYYRLGSPVGAAFRVPGVQSPIIIEGDDLKLLSKGELFERTTRTIPVILETGNPDGLLKIGQVVQLELFTSEAAVSNAVPAGSLIDEDYGEYVFVQTGGESFEKRAVKTGARYLGMVAITDGLSEGERVVSTGAYQVKLASTTKNIGHAHVH
jgi:RND family efflux transporter MFP subunit